MLNKNFDLLKREYIFPIIEKKLEDLLKSVPKSEVVNLGIGDVALPLSPSVAKAIASACYEMTRPETLRGYGPSAGYPFLRQEIAQNEYSKLQIQANEIFISDGINTDITAIQELFAPGLKIAIPDPTYPAYLDSNIIAGRAHDIHLLPCTKETGFVPAVPTEHFDLIFLVSPSNPTGVAMNRIQLKEWIDYARREKAIIFFDAAYAAFINSAEVPHSIFEIPGAHEVAIEFRSFSKSAGFTGIRCSYTVISKHLKVDSGDKKVSLKDLWNKRQNIKYNGLAYPIQRGAEATYSESGKQETKSQVLYYLAQAKKLKAGLIAQGFECYGGEDSPYIWWKTPNNLGSWEFFDLLLEKCHIVAVPGEGFGNCGKGYIRLSAFTTEEKVNQALNNIQALSHLCDLV